MKTSLPFGVAFVRGLLCNVFVCLAIWQATAATSLTGKFLGAWLPVSAFAVSTGAARTGFVRQAPCARQAGPRRSCKVIGHCAAAPCSSDPPSSAARRPLLPRPSALSTPSR
jgi:hypothetical protein